MVEGTVSRFFAMEKDFVFNVLDELGIEVTRAQRDALSEVPTESFQAFLAYSQGLELQSQQMAAEASKEFRRALELDPGFEMAQQELAVSQALEAGGGSLDQLYGALESEVESGDQEHTLDGRLVQVASNSGTATARDDGSNGVTEVPPTGVGTGSISVSIRGEDGQ
jgi:hypothetical protein